MKRSGPPKRRTPLSPGRGLSRGKGLKRARRTRTPKEREDALAFKRAVFVACKGRCIVTDQRLTDEDDAHHVIEKQRLRRDGHDEWDPRWGVGVKRLVHGRHTLAFERIPRERLPAYAVEMAVRHGYEHLIERYYPESKAAAANGGT